MRLLANDRELARDSYYAATAPRGDGYAPLAVTPRAMWHRSARLAGLSAALGSHSAASTCAC